MSRGHAVKLRVGTLQTLSFAAQKSTNYIRIFMYTVSQKNIPDVFGYDSRKHCRIFIIFGRNITKQTSNQKMLYFPTSLN